MGKRRSQDFSKKNLILKSVWLGIAILFFVIGIVTFLSMVGQETEGAPIYAWVAGGAICCIPIIWKIIKFIGGQTKKGWKEGANTYETTVTVGAQYVTAETKNHPFREAVFGFLGGLIAALLGGMLVLPIFIIIEVVYVVRCSIWLSKQKKAETTSAE